MRRSIAGVIARILHIRRGGEHLGMHSSVTSMHPAGFNSGTLHVEGRPLDRRRRDANIHSREARSMLCARDASRAIADAGAYNGHVSTRAFRIGD